jgi:hypothetical protein
MKKILKQQQGTNNYIIQGQFGNIVGEVPRKKGEHEDDHKIRAEKARKEAERNRKN